MNPEKIPCILAKIQNETLRQDAITTLGCKTEKDARHAAREWCSPATRAEIVAAIEELQQVKGFNPQ